MVQYNMRTGYLKRILLLTNLLVSNLLIIFITLIKRLKANKINNRNILINKT